MRLICLISVCWMLLGIAPAHAETFQGRKLIVTDGRVTTARPAPVIIAMHGFLGTPANMQRKTGFDAIARKHGLIAVYPKGKKRRWNDGRRTGQPTDDVAYLSALVRRLIAEGRADPRRIYWTGHSNGGGMAMRMACDRPDLVAGIAVVATKVPVGYACKDGPPVPAAFLHGTADPIAPHDGRSADSRLGHAYSAEASMRIWQRRNRCGNPSAPRIVDRADDGTRALISLYSGCKKALAYALIEGHGHDWPRPGRRSTRLQGPASQELAASTWIWRFLERTAPR